MLSHTVFCADLTDLQNRNVCPTPIPTLAILLVRFQYVHGNGFKPADEARHRGRPPIRPANCVIPHAWVCVRVCCVSDLRFRSRRYSCVCDRNGFHRSQSDPREHVTVEMERYHGQRRRRLAQNKIREAMGKRPRSGRMVHVTRADLGACICLLPRFGH